jgi:hypothetical protein
MFVQRLGEGYPSERDHFPVIEIQIVQHPRADHAAQEPGEHDYAESELHSPPLANPLTLSRNGA